MFIIIGANSFNEAIICLMLELSFIMLIQSGERKSGLTSYHSSRYSPNFYGGKFVPVAVINLIRCFWKSRVQLFFVSTVLFVMAILLKLSLTLSVSLVLPRF